MTANLSGYNFAYLDEQTKRMIRRALLKAVAIPGYQVPFGGREMPMPYGWGTGGIQLTASVIGEADVLKVIDQGADDTTNAVSIRNFFRHVTGVNTTDATCDATLIQTRHRIPETPLTEDQIIIFQVPIPEPLRFIEPRETETRTMHALEEYGVMQVKLYEDIARFGHIATTYAYPVKVNGRYVMDPSPIQNSTTRKWTGCPRCSCSGPGVKNASTPYRRIPESRASISTITRLPCRAGMNPAPSAVPPTAISTKWCSTTAANGCLSAPTPTTAANRARPLANDATAAFRQ